MRVIPPELMVEEAMSDVADDEYDSDSIPAEVTRDEYRKARPVFDYEGRPPFFRPREVSRALFSFEVIFDAPPNITIALEHHFCSNGQNNEPQRPGLRDPGALLCWQHHSWPEEQYKSGDGVLNSDGGTLSMPHLQGMVRSSLRRSAKSHQA